MIYEVETVIVNHIKSIAMSKIIKALEPKITSEMEVKWMPEFHKQARHFATGVFSIPATNLVSNSVRELFLMFVAVHENIPIPE